jgi:transcriptional regulator with XRE-family HTH domain
MLAMPYSLRDQPARIEAILVHLGFEIRSARYRRTGTQTALSEQAGVSQSTWSMVENGLAEGIRLETLARIVSVLGGDLGVVRCDHPDEVDTDPSNGRFQRVEGATLIPGTRRLMPGAGWRPRDPW